MRHLLFVFRSDFTRWMSTIQLLILKCDIRIWYVRDATLIKIILVNTPQILLCILFYQLSPQIEIPVTPREAKIANPVSMFMGLHKSKMIVVKLSALFMLDSFGGSFVLQSIMSDWFYMKYVLHSVSVFTICFFFFYCYCVTLLRILCSLLSTMLSFIFYMLFDYAILWNIILT